MKCPICGATMVGTSYCPKCGYSLDNDVKSNSKKIFIDGLNDDDDINDDSDKTNDEDFEGDDSF